MNYEIHVIIIALLMAAVLAGNIAVFIYFRRVIPAAKYLAFFATSVTIWALFFIFEIVANELAQKDLFFNLKYLGIVLVPLSLVLFALTFTRTRVRIRLATGLLVVEPLITTIVIWTNPWHGWFIHQASVRVTQDFLIHVIVPGIWFKVNLIYSLVLIGIAIGLFIRYSFKAGPYQRSQIGLIVIGMIGPLLALGAYLFFRRDFAFDISPIAFAAGLPCMVYGLLRNRLLDVVPGARDTLIELLRDCVVILNPSDKIIDINPAAGILFQVDPTAVVGTPFQIIFPQWNQLDPGPGTERYQLGIEIEAAGDKRYFDFQIFSLHTWRDHLYGRLVLLHEVTQSIELEDSLRLAKERAEEGAQAKALFLANVSHEIRTPLNAVIGIANLLLDSKLPDEMEEPVQVIRASGNSLLDLINQILDYSRIESGHIDLVQQPFSLYTCIEEALNVIQPGAQSNADQVNLYLGSGVPDWLIGDAAHVRQILINLLSNAVKFTHMGTINLSVDSKPAAAGRVEVHILVEDTGIGIAPGRVKSIFEAFNQGEESLTGQYGGSGLGLAICKRLVTLMDGKIWAEKREDFPGAIFQCLISFQEARSEAAQQDAHRRAMLAGKHLIIYAQAPLVCQTICNVLAQWNVQVTCGATFEELREILSGDAPVDMVMSESPDVNGNSLRGLCEWLSSMPARAQVPVVCLMPSGKVVPADLRALLAGVLFQPFRPGQFFRILQNKFGASEPIAEWSDSTSNEAVTTEFAEHYPLNILVADDNIVNRRVVFHYLKRLGYQVDVVTSGEEVLAVLKDAAYDLVMMDIRMPEMDGFEAMRRIRALTDLPHQPKILALTANHYEANSPEYTTSGFDGFIEKPIQLPAFMEALRCCSQPASVAAAAISTQAPPQPETSLPLWQELGAEGREIVAAFRSEACAQFAELQQAVIRGDFNAVGDAAHLLKTSLAYLGFSYQSKLCLQIESGAHRAELPEAATLAIIEELTAQWCDRKES